MENIKVVSDINYLREAVHLLIKVKTKKNYQQCQNELSVKSSVISDKFVILSGMEQELSKRLKDKQADLDYYFGKEFSDGINIGQLAICADEFAMCKYKTTSELAKYLISQTKEEYNKSFAEGLGWYASILNTENDDNSYEALDIVKMIMDMDATDEEKWKIQNIFFYPEKHREKVLKLVEEAIDVIKSFEKELKPFTKSFEKYWNKKIKEVDMLEYINKSLNIALDANDNGIVISPSIVMFNTFNAFADGSDKVIDTPYYFNMGFMFDDDFTLERKLITDIDEDTVIKGLKLLSDKSKFDILKMIRDRKAYGSELAKELGLTTATISHHMSALLNAGFVSIEKDDTKVYYTTNKDNIEKIIKYCMEKLL